MASSCSIRSCPICKRQLKKEEFQELTSGVCSICQNTPKLPVLTTSGSLSCWACHYKTQCDQGLETSQVIPIYGTEDESEGEADPAVPPRPVLQPDDNSGSSTHVIQIDEDGSSSAISSESNRFFDTIKLIFQVIGFIISFVGISILVIIMTFPLIGVFFLPWTASTVEAHYAKCGFFFLGELICLTSVTVLPCALLPWAGSKEKKWKIVKVVYGLGKLISAISFTAIYVFTMPTLANNGFALIWHVIFFILTIIHLACCRLL
jgi:hypothetical protein